MPWWAASRRGMVIEAGRSTRSLGLMRSIASIASLALLAACAVTREYYVPVDNSLLQEGTTCGSVPFGDVSLPLAPDLRAGISIAPGDQSIGVSIQISVPQGMTVKLRDPLLKFEVPSTNVSYLVPLGQWKLSIYGRRGAPGHHEFFEPTARLEGQGRNAELATPETLYLRRDLFIAGGETRTPTSAEVVMTFPPIEVNGVVIPAKSVPLRLEKKAGVMTCVQ